MTPQELQAVKIGDNVRLRATRGRVTQTTKTWFMVMWDNGTPEIIKRTPTILGGRLELEAHDVVTTAPEPKRRHRADIDG